MMIKTAIVLLSLFASANGQCKSFSVPLSGDQEVPPITTANTGSAVVTVCEANNQVCMTLDTTIAPDRLLGAPGGHLHNAPAGANGDVVTLFFDGITAVPDFNGCIDADSGLISAILADPSDYYVNIHSLDFMPGELRGQLPAVATGQCTSFNVPLSGDQEVPPISTENTGNAVVSVCEGTNQVCLDLDVTIDPDRLLGAPGGHLHNAPKGANGDVVVLFFDGLTALPDFGGCTVADPALISAILANPIDYYVNIHSLDFMPGELRGQLPANNVGANDDPHFKTWTGKFYDFMGACDLVLVHAPKFDTDLTLDIIIRTKIRYEYSFIESAVVKIGDEKLEVGSWGDYFLNGVADAELPNNLSGFPVTHSQPNEKVHLFTIDLGNGEEIILRTFKDWVSVKINNGSEHNFHGSHGMMGEYGTGKLLGRDELSVIEDPEALAAEWQVREDEPMLFQVTRGPQHPQACIMPDPTKASGRRLGEMSISLEAATKACMVAGAENMEGCVHDVIAVGDLELAAAGAM